MNNEMTLTFSSQSRNESFARATVAAFITPLDPTLDELTEIKTVVSEAVTNAIIHGYHENPYREITITCRILAHRTFELTVQDTGVGIDDIEQAKEPLYTSKPELERSGMGFMIMESFMDELTVHSVVKKGTTVTLKKQLTTVETVCH